jgi:predicted AlkP superfamily phosphohydrolase/phosphomutase
VLTADGVGAQTWPRALYDEILPLIRPAETVTFEEAARFIDLEEEELGLDIVEGFRWAYAADETYLAVAEHLLARDPDIALWGLYFNGIDVVSHRYWKYLEPSRYRDVDPAEIPRFRSVIERYYVYTDGVLGRILEQRRPGDTFVIVSDHGFHAYGHKDGPAGILVMAGEHVAAGASADDAELADITPTVLALLGLPVAEDMDGRILDELFTETWREKRPAARIATYDTAEWLEARDRTPVPSDADAELLERLEALGYLD